MRIGEVAKRAGIATSAIRYYERIGLIESPKRTESGYRDFSREVIDQLSFISAGQSVGLKLDELKGVMAIRRDGETPCGHVAEMIEARISDIDETIDQLQGMRTDLTALSRRAADLDPRDCPPESICHIITR